MSAWAAVMNFANEQISDIRTRTCFLAIMATSMIEMSIADLAKLLELRTDDDVFSYVEKFRQAEAEASDKEVLQAP